MAARSSPPETSILRGFAGSATAMVSHGRQGIRRVLALEAEVAVLRERLTKR